MKWVFAGAREILPTLRLLVFLPEGKPHFALKNFFKRAIHSGGTVPGKISDAPLCEAAFSCYSDAKAGGIGRQRCFH
ncbi:MAG: hypothetical protein JXL20_05415 [Deltaproteobacteria bacterium]|nr:hypothetical protein [Deltaproteobacteria bacterium]